MRGYVSTDFKIYKIWYEALKIHGMAVFGVVEAKTIHYNYSPMYMYILYLVSILFPKLVTISAVKIIPVTTDLIGALFVYKIVRLKYDQGAIPFFASFAYLFAPTIFLNSSVWGQTDSIYTAFLIATLYFIMKKQNWWACLAYGLSFSMKPQAIFFAPFLFALFVKKEISWKQILLIPAIYFVLLIPAWIAGRPIGDLLTIYLSQSDQFNYFEVSFPNIYFQLPDELFRVFYPATLVLAGSMALLYVGSIYKSHKQLSHSILILFALISLVFMPYFLPKMHDRYLYAADALSIVFGFYFPEFFFIPVIINLYSFFIYEATLFNMDNVPGYVLQIALTFVVVFLGKIMITYLYSSKQTPRADQSE